MINNEELQGQVIAALVADASLDTSRIGVAVMDGVVTLVGYINSPEDWGKVKAAMLRESGARALVNELDILE